MPLQDFGKGNLKAMNKTIDIAVLKGRILERLPAIPKVVHEVWQLIDKKDIAPSKISEVISKDITLSAKVLRLVNSPFYGFPNRIGSIKHAVVLLGLDAIRGLLISTVVFGNISQDIKDMWTHACDCAAIAGILGRSLNIKEVDELTAAGLLHDMGKVIIKNYFPDLDKRIKAIKGLYNLSDYEAERKVMGISHDTINKWITEKWHFPPMLTEILIYHHNIKGSRKHPVFTALISMADLLSYLYRLQPDKTTIPHIEDNICQILGLDISILGDILFEIDKTLNAFNWDEL